MASKRSVVEVVVDGVYLLLVHTDLAQATGLTSSKPGDEVSCRVQDFSGYFIPAVAEEWCIGIDELTCRVGWESKGGGGGAGDGEEAMSLL